MIWQAIADTYSQMENHVIIMISVFMLIALVIRIIDMIIDNGNITANIIEIAVLILAIVFIVIPTPERIISDIRKKAETTIVSDLEAKRQQYNQDDYIPISTEYIDIADSRSKTVTEYVNASDKTIRIKTVEYNSNTVISESFSQKLNDDNTPATYTGDIDKLQNFYNN